jgi:hypothetical protein
MLRASYIAVFALVATLLPASRAGAAQPSLEYEVKAAFLYNFAKFVEWPPQAFAAEDAPLVFCVLGENPFEDKLGRVVNDRTANGRRIAVQPMPPAAETQGCHLVFVAAAEDERVARLVQTLHSSEGAPVLTVGESDRFAGAGGMIRLVIDDGRVRFDINAAAAEQSGLKLSSQLLKLAREVER